MAQQNRPNNRPNTQLNLTPEIVEKFLDVEQSRLSTHAQSLSLQEKEIASNERIAMKSLDLQAAHLKRNPGENRKTLITVASIVFLFASLLTWVICYLLHTGEKDIVHKILLGLSHLATGIIGFLAAKRKNKAPEIDNSIPTAEVVED